jgi:hypothetical protein
MKALNRMGAALKYAQDAGNPKRMRNGLSFDNQLDICWPVMPVAKHLSSNTRGAI